MNKDIQSILEFIQQANHLGDEEKTALLKAAKNANKELEITSFKLERTEKVKHTTSILLEETIEELEQKRKAVEAQNRELEIESSLERVRTAAMAMKQPADMVDICHIISDQLELLNVKEIRNIQTAIFYEDRGTYFNFEFYALHNKSFVTEVEYINHPMSAEFANRMLKGSGMFYIRNLDEKELKDWYEFQKTTNQFIDTHLEVASSLNYYWYSLGPVALGISTYKALTEEETNLFKRFLKVFELSYRRYLDIEKAIGQAKEAKIEASLERVRAVAMAMKKSEELITVCEVMYKELLQLGFTNIRNAQIAIENEEKKSYSIYVYSPFEQITGGEFGIDSSPITSNLYKVLGKSTHGFYEKQYSEKEMEEWRAWRKTIAPFNDHREETVSSLCWYMYSVGNGHIGISTFDPIGKEEIEIVKRFKNVFALSYQRFDDLQKAEAQAREAQIETSLERVRSKTMAMHSTNDVGDTVATMFDEFVRLGIQTNRCGIVILSDEPDAEVWTAKSNPGGKANLIIGKLDMIVHPLLQGIDDGWKKKESFYTYTMEGNDLRNYYQALNDLEYYPVKFDMNALPSKEFHSDFYFPEGSVFTFTGEPIPDEVSRLIKRFAAVFGQTYRRYLDLQKAEAQARESQIQLALERIRARTMAMQKSEELAETVSLLFKQLIDLGIKATQMRTCAIVTLKPDQPIGECWITKPDGEIIPQSFIVPYDETSAYKTIYAAWKNGEKFLVVNLSGDALVQHLNFLKKYAKIPTQQFQALPDQPNETFTHAMFFSQGYLFIISSEPLPQYHDIFKRFGKVFEQTYTRFLDLQKAEAQARESRIETALEKIRSRSLAMHKSDELWEVVAVVFEKLQELQFSIDGAAFIITFIEGTKDINAWLAGVGDQLYPTNLRLPYYDSPSINDFWLAKESGLDFVSKTYSFEEKNHWLSYAFEHTDLKTMTDEFKNWILEQPYLTQSFALAKNSMIGIHFHYQKTLSETEVDILKRFSKVFDQAYIRFLDLQKAEAQARESQIQLALERVRARTMAMQKSDELSETVFILFQQFKELGENPDQATIGVINENEWVIEYWVTMYGNQMNRVFKFSIDEPDVTNKIYNAWKEQKKSLVIYLSGKELYDFATYRASMGGAVYNEAEKRRVINVAFFSKGILNVQSNESRSPESIMLLERFAKVFEQTYTRFLDLQKAEAQARESQIQLALERVRARTMAMQKSDELKVAAALLFQQVKSLGVPAYSCGYNIWEKNEKTFTSWMSSEDGSIINAVLNIPLTEDANFIRYADSKQKDEQFFVLELRGERMQEHYEYLKTIPAFKAYFDYAVSVGFDLPETQIHHLANFSQGNLLFITLEPCPEFHDVFKRFAAVFEQTYTRFLDLQKAEAQSRESQIQLALERVRARTMAMQKSDELAETAMVLFQQLNSLEIKSERIFIGIVNDKTGKIDFWGTEQGGNQISTRFEVDVNATFGFRQIYKAWQDKKKHVTVVLKGNDLKEHIHYVRDVVGMPVREELIQEQRNLYNAFFSKGLVTIVTPETQSEETLDILGRFAGVFNLTYTRFLDIQKAEAQTREATIEAALEKVRGKAMAMHNSDDLSATASLVFTELRKLGVNPIRSGVGIFSKESQRLQFYSAAHSANGDSLSFTGGLNISSHPEFEKQYQSWLKKENYFTVLKGEALESYYKVLSESYIQSDFNIKNVQEQYGHWIMFSEGFLFAWAEAQYNDEEIKILKRFATIIDLTFRRYIELKKSEANTKEAVKQAALDRIRADIASMRTVSDLERITPLIWNELTVLGISFMRCGVFIMDEEQELIHTFLSAPDGIAIAAFHIPYSTQGNIQDVLHHWKDKKNYINHWDESSFKEFADTLVKQGVLASSEQYLQTIPHGGFHLHFLPFLQGMLYVGNSTQLVEEEINLIQSVADAFSTAYARYEDFNKLEAAKQQVDKTLVDLKQAQSQLIQAEKMASLGELTAGIAHEIQNPLNFVNNFSEVNKELLMEMKDEINKGNIDEVRFITDDIIANEEKINHHGKRAGAIVKGMLQHSRTSASQKEPTDINALTDEYLRLAYHGLRAKDKSFNAEMKTDFDKTIGKINIIPQDIGRVLLNLYNNAFYAVSEKMKQKSNGYKPVISIITKKAGDRVLISVSDNGNGIPKKILDKIFQPFFTTKPTGQGTGLGLSLSYDIIKAHGGEIKVETKEGEGSEFIIQLPV